LALPDGTLIAATDSGAVFMPDPASQPGVGTRCMQGTTVLDMDYDAITGAVFLGTDGDYIMRWDPQLDQCDTQRIGQGNSPLQGNDDVVRAVLADSTGMWFGTDRPTMAHLDTANDIWIIHRSNNSPLEAGRRINDLALEVQSLGSPAAPREIIWAALDGATDFSPAVLRRDEVLPAWTQFSVVPDGVADRRVRTIVVDAAGNKWISTRNGVSVYTWP